MTTDNFICFSGAFNGLYELLYRKESLCEDTFKNCFM